MQSLAGIPESWPVSGTPFCGLYSTLVPGVLSKEEGERGKVESGDKAVATALVHSAVSRALDILAVCSSEPALEVSQDRRKKT